MTLLITFLLVALVFSFLCSIAEAVLLSVTVPYIVLLEKKGNPSAPLLRELRTKINKPLSAILTLNTIAHTIGAAGVGAQVTIVFGNAFLGIASVILTLLILIFSEIIPKTLGAHHWRKLAPLTAYGLRFLVWLLYPFVWLTEKMTGGLAEGPTLSGFSRQEFAAMAEISAQEGQLAHRESELLRNLLLQRETLVRDALTPRTVVFSLPAASTVADFFANHETVRFSRIPVYRDDRDMLEGFVLRNDMLLAHTKGQTDMRIEQLKRPLPVLPDSLALAKAFDWILRERVHIVQVVDEYGGLAGILTLEDIIETLLGLEIVDEGDKAVDMQEYARRKWRRRARKMGFLIDK